MKSLMIIAISCFAVVFIGVASAQADSPPAQEIAHSDFVVENSEMIATLALGTQTFTIADNLGGRPSITCAVFHSDGSQCIWYFPEIKLNTNDDGIEIEKDDWRATDQPKEHAEDIEKPGLHSPSDVLRE